MDKFLISQIFQAKFFKVMRLTLLFWICLFLQLSAVDGYSQLRRISIIAENALLSDVLDEMERQSGYLFYYSRQNIDADKQVTVNEQDKPVKEILDNLLGSDYTYTMVNDHVVISKKEDNSTFKAFIQQSGKRITGKVVDSSGEAIVGANVVEKGTTNGTSTDSDGNFTLTVAENAILQVSYVGYAAQELTVGNQSSFAVTLSEDTQALDEVVVVGYGVQKKRDLTGAISSIKLDDAPVQTVSTVSHILAGKAAGLQVNTVSAQPGGGASYRIRGAASISAGNDPLIIIDGFPVKDPGGLNAGRYTDGTKDNILGSINPNDIESVEVLKDASSTAIYGARAGNGVIIITTKRGSSGAPVVKYSATVASQSIAKNFEVLNAHDFMVQANRYDYEVWLRQNKVGVYGNVSESSLSPFIPRYTDAMISNPANETDWIDEVTRTGFMTQHNISVNGGNEYTKYLISGNYFDQKGIVKNDGLERFTGRLNIDQKLGKYVRAGVNLTVSRKTEKNVALNPNWAASAGILVAATQFNPLIPVKDENGDYPIEVTAPYNPNPVSLLEVDDIGVKERLLGSVYVEFEPVKGLIFKINGGIDRNYAKRKQYVPKSTLQGKQVGGRADIGQTDHSDYLLDLTANYSKKIDNHSFTVLAGYSFQRFMYESLWGGNEDFLIDGFLYNNLEAGNAARPTVGSWATKDELASFFGRLNYSFMDKYLLQATIRADGASNFSEDHRWGYFPSVSVGWRFLEEDFLKPLSSVFSNGKLRLSYGETGNSNIGYSAISYYQVGNNNTFGNETQYKGVYLAQMANTSLKWETTKEFNAGLDLGFFNNRLNITAEYFDRVIADLLSSRSLLSYYEVSSIAANIGSTQSRGFELTVNSVNANNRDFSWNTDFTFSFYRDRWKERADTWKPAAYEFVDAPIRASYGFLTDGLIQAGETVPHQPGALPGVIKVKDIDGFQYNSDGSIKTDENGRFLKTGQPDGKLDDADKVFYGSTDPKYLVGLNNTVRWKNFDFNIYFYGQLGLLKGGTYKDLWLIQGVSDLSVYQIKQNYNMPVSMKDCWTHDYQTTTQPSFFQVDYRSYIGDYYNSNSWFVRCRNITLGYTIPVNKNVLSLIRVYADVNNPFVITPYKGLDPETDNSTYAYPNSRTFSLGLDITF
jgi:TonB-linked SusC/RagA family outer membrane protein